MLISLFNAKFQYNTGINTSKDNHVLKRVGAPQDLSNRLYTTYSGLFLTTLKPYGTQMREIH